MTGPPMAVLVRAALALALLGGAGVLAAVGTEAALVGTLIAAGLILGAWALGAAAHSLVPGEPDVEQRDNKGPGLERRKLILGTGAGAATVAAVAVGIVGARRSADAEDRLRGTEWSAGTRVVDAEGHPVVVDDLAEGELVTVYPEGAVGSITAQAVLVREAADRYRPDPEREGWVADGVAVYSKLCTHMACPVGLYESTAGTILCPCHQAVFDVFDGGRAIEGPARRALPQLPVSVTDDGHLMAEGDFSDAVGTGFWGRP